MKYIVLSQGKEAIVDDEDYDLISSHKWSFDGNYAIRMVRLDGKQRCVLMHRVLNNTPKGKHTDHINGDKLDNRRENLRVCTSSQNHMNKISKRGTSKYKGVYKEKRRKGWIVRIKRIYIGEFSCEIEAAKAYNEAAIREFGEFARLNVI